MTLRALLLVALLLLVGGCKSGRSRDGDDSSSSERSSNEREGDEESSKEKESDDDSSSERERGIAPMSGVPNAPVMGSESVGGAGGGGVGSAAKDMARRKTAPSAPGQTDDDSGE